MDPELQSVSRKAWGDLETLHVVGYFAPEHKHAVLYVVNAAAVIGAIVCAVKVYLVRRAADDQGASSRTNSTTR